MRIALIARSPEHSPNMGKNDTAILECVAEELSRMGAEVYRIEKDTPVPDGTDAICHMARGEKTLSLIEEAERRGVIAVNPAEAVRKCSRIDFMTMLLECRIKQPHFEIIDAGDDLNRLCYPAWIKRADGWSCHKDDVCYVESASDAETAIARMSTRGINRYIWSKHAEGDIVKFYGIGGTFFHCSYPNPETTKFGLERFNGKPSQYEFNRHELETIAVTAAKRLGLVVYGGDCIITKNGEILIIDINDFPSFSSIREKAARMIARLITVKTDKI